MSAPQVLGPETHPDGGSGGSGGSGSGAVGSLQHLYHQQPQFNVKESTLVISNISTCTLKLNGGGSCGSFLKKKNNNGSTYTVQFNKETTKTTKSSEFQIVGSSVPPDSMASEDMGSAMTPVHEGKNSIVSIANDVSVSSGGHRGRPPDGSKRSGTESTGQADAVNVKSSSRPCCFCWCCCCSCSWIRRRCLSVKAPNGSLDNANEPIRDEELGNINAADVQSWGDAFEKLMGSEGGRKVFRSFLRCEYSEENILFWLACEDLKKERNPEMIEEKARVIYEDYVSILSPREVSLDSRVRDIINRNMIAPSQHTFDEAQLQIYTLMHRDSYPRFVNSPTYKNLLRTVGVELAESSTCSS